MFLSEIINIFAKKMKLYIGVKHDEYGNSCYIMSIKEDKVIFGYLPSAIFITKDMKRKVKKLLKKNGEHNCELTLIEKFPLLDVDVLGKLSVYQPITHEPLSDFFYHTNITYKECVKFLYENFTSFKNFKEFTIKASAYIIEKYKLKLL